MTLRTASSALAIASLTLACLRLLGMSLRAADHNPGSPTSGSATASTNASSPQKTKLDTVIIVYKTHFDLGYTALAREVVHYYRSEMTDKVLETIEQNSRQPKDQQFVWTVSGWPMKQILGEGQSPEHRGKLEQAIRDGNLAIHAYPFTTHTEMAELEDLVRGLNISSALDRQFGLPLSTAAKMSDVPGQSWIFPTLFAHAGIKFYHMGGPVVNKALGLPPFFWWQGPDGSRLLTLYDNGYGSSALPPPDWPFKTWVYINMTGDNQGPPGPDRVKEDVAFFSQRGIKARVGKLDDFAELILKEDLSRLPIIRSDIPDPWIHGPMSSPEACKLAQNIRLAIGSADELTSLERCWGVYRPDISKAISTAYEKSLLFSEHTWGMANQHYVQTPYGKAWDALWSRGLPPNYKLMEESWREHSAHIEEVQRLVTDPYADALMTLCDNVNVAGPRIVVYNPLPWKRDGEVTLNVFHLPVGASLKPADGGPAIPFAAEGPAIEDPYRVIRFVAKGIPAMGYRTYLVSKESMGPDGLAADEPSGVIESPFYRATLDPKHGRIASLIDKRSGRELVDAEAPQGFGQYFYERFGFKDLSDWLDKSLYPQYQAHRSIFVAYDLPKDSAYTSALPENMTLSVKKTAIDVTAVMVGEIHGSGSPQKLFIRLTLPATLPVADLEVGWDKQPDSWPEAAWICLPFKCAKPKFRLGRLGADVDPVKDFTVDNANYHFSWINTGVGVYDSETGAGIALCPQDSPLVSLGEPGDYKFDPRFEPKKPHVFVHLYNNHWRTNFRAWISDGRRMTSRIRLWSFDQFDAEAALYSPAMETRTPLAAARSTALPGKLPGVQSGITLSRKGVAVTAFGPNPDGSGIVLRLWEQSGTSGPLSVTLPIGLKATKAQAVSLRGEKTGDPMAIINGKLDVSLPAYAPASFILEL
jgi:hypothetical protein